MCFHVQAFSGLNQTSLLPFFPQEPSSSTRYPCGCDCSRYSAQVTSLMGQPGSAYFFAMFFSQVTPSNHQCPKSSASKGAHKMGGAPPFFGSEPSTPQVMPTKCSACARVRFSASCG